MVKISWTNGNRQMAALASAILTLLDLTVNTNQSLSTSVHPELKRLHSFSHTFRPLCLL